MDVTLLTSQYSQEMTGLVCLQDKLLMLEEEEEEDSLPSVPTDGMFIWRTIMAILASLSAITGTAVVGLDYAMHQVKFKPTNKRI